MNLTESLNDGFSKIFAKFLENVEQVAKDKAQEPRRTLCLYKLTRGKNAGQYCKNKAVNSGYCGKHQSGLTEMISSIAPKAKTPKQPKAMTKTQLQIIEWLNTAIPQEETVLKKRSKGLLHEETDIIFDENFTVIGRLNGKGEIVGLSDFEVDMCEKNGWRYDEKAVEETSE